jgi:hypothetical protein
MNKERKFEKKGSVGGKSREKKKKADEVKGGRTESKMLPWQFGKFVKFAKYCQQY